MKLWIILLVFVAAYAAGVVSTYSVQSYMKRKYSGLYY